MALGLRWLSDTASKYFGAGPRVIRARLRAPPSPSTRRVTSCWCTYPDLQGKRTERRVAEPLR